MGIADELLEQLRTELGPDVDYLEPPQLLSGGFYTANHRFTITGAPPPWHRPMVLRLFPSHAPHTLAPWEAAVQSFVHDRGLPAPKVTLDDPGTTIVGRAWFVMELLPGRPAMNGVEVRSMARDARTTVRELPALAASVHLDVHRLDPRPLVDEFGAEATVERWWTVLGATEGRDVLRPALDWLQANVPAPRAPDVLCHGDTWGGNVLVDDDRRVTGIIDWSVATVAEPGLEVGFLCMALSLAPVGLPRPIQHFVQRMGRRVARTYRSCYEAGSAAEVGSVPYYEALRCGIELRSVVDYRIAAAVGAAYDSPRPSWDRIGADMVDYFEARTGVRLQIPSPVS